MPNPDDDQKVEFETSFRYAARVLVGMSRHYLRHGAEIAEVINDDDPKHTTADALFEIILVRLRSFDDFLRSRGRGDDAVADDWVDWTSQGIFDNDERQKINKRIPHLTYSQPAAHEWPIGMMIRKCFEVLDRFLDQLQTYPDNWEGAHDYIKEFLDEHVAENWDEIWTETDQHAQRRS